MSDTSDFKKLDLDEQTADDEGGSFATWLPPMLSADPKPARAPATLTGLGPPSGPRVSPAAADEADLGWDDTSEGNLAPALAEPKVEEPLYTEPSDYDDDDDAPTRVISQLFPNLTPKARAVPPTENLSEPAAVAAVAAPAVDADAPRADAVAATDADAARAPDAGDGASAANVAAAAANELPDDALHDAVPESGSSESLTSAGRTKVFTVAEAAPAGDDDVTAVPPAVSAAPVALEQRGAMAHAQTQESELLSLMVESLAKRRSSPVRYSAPIVRETESAEPPTSSVEFIESSTPSLAPPEVPTGKETTTSARPVPVYPPTIEIAQYERELPTAPSSRRPTPPGEVTTTTRAPRATPVRSEPPWATTVRPKSSPAPRVALKYAVGAFAASALVTVLVLRALLPGKGTVLVTAVGATGMPVENAQVLVDGAPACAPVPCRVSKLREGRHLVSVKAAGYQPIAERAVTVDSESEALVHFALTPENNAGIHVRVDARGLRVFLDGEDRGEAPLTLAGLPPGEHTIRLAGSPLYAAFEQKVTLRPNSTLTFTPNLIALQAFITITAGAGAESASVEVIGGPQRKAVVELPARIEVPPLGIYRVRATRPGYQDFETSVQFGNGEAEKQVRIDLTPASAPTAAAAPARPATVPVVLEESPATPKPAAPATPAVAETGSLSVSSVPASNVIVDGRPMGSTPRQVALPPGNHTVVFVHPTHGRRTVNVKVEPGKAAVASTRF